MKHLLQVLFLFALAHGAAFAQISLDSAFWDEKEDSLSSLAIKPVKHPKKLLKQVINRLHKDLQETHQARSYRVEGTFRRGSRPPFYASCIYHVEGDNGLEIVEPSNRDTNSIKAPKLEDFCYEGLYGLNREDSIYALFYLVDILKFSPSHSSNNYYQAYYPPSPFIYYEETARWYDVKAYEINYGQERGAYRILLKKKKDRYLWRSGDKNHWIPDIEFTAYFDQRSLRITQLKGQQIAKKGQAYPFDKMTDSCTRFQADYDEKTGTPVLKQIRIISNSSNSTLNGTVRRIDEQNTSSSL